MSDFSVTEEESDMVCDLLFQTRPDIDKTRADYYLPLLSGAASNVFFVNGALDPWSTLGFTDPHNAPPGATVFMIAQGAHHDELANLTPDSPIPVFEAHVLFNRLAKRWLAD